MTERQDSITQRATPAGISGLPANLKEALSHFNKSDGWAMGSHIALSLMIALFPFLIFAASLAGFLDNSVQSRNIVELTFENWPDEIAEPIVREIGVVLAQSNAGFLTLGVGLALFFASNGIEAVRVALNRAYRETDRRPFWKQRLQSLAFVVIGATLLVLVSVQLVLAPMHLSFIEKALPTVYALFFESEPLRLSAGSLLLAFAVYAAHRWLPVTQRPFRRIWPGIALTLVSWLVAGLGFSAYLRIFANYSATYAGLAGIMTALIFLYLMAAILIFGAEFNAALEQSAKAATAE